MAFSMLVLRRTLFFSTVRRFYFILLSAQNSTIQLNYASFGGERYVSPRRCANITMPGFVCQGYDKLKTDPFSCKTQNEKIFFIFLFFYFIQLGNSLNTSAISFLAGLPVVASHLRSSPSMSTTIKVK